MIVLPQMHQLMDQDIIDKPDRQLQKTPVKIQDLVFAAGPPAISQIPDHDSGSRCSGPRFPIRHPVTEPFMASILKPILEMLGYLQAIFLPEVEPLPVKLQGLVLLGHNLKPIVLPQIRYIFPADRTTST